MINWIVLVLAILAIGGILFITDIYTKIAEIKFRCERGLEAYDAVKKAEQEKKAKQAKKAKAKPTKKGRGK